MEYSNILLKIRIFFTGLSHTGIISASAFILISAFLRQEYLLFCFALFFSPLILYKLMLTDSSASFAVMLFPVCIFCIVFFPGALTYGLTLPEPYEIFAQVTVFLISLSWGILYFRKNFFRLRSVADKLIFFTGLCLGPAGIIRLFF